MTLTSLILPRNWWLMALAIGLAILIVVVRPPAAVERPVSPLFPGFDAAEITEIRVQTPMDGGGEPETVTLTRASADEPWAVKELHGAPGNAIRIGSVMSWVGTMTDLDVVSSGTGPASDYGLGEGEAVKVTLQRGRNGAEAWSGAGPEAGSALGPGNAAEGGPEGGTGGGPASRVGLVSEGISFFAAPAEGGGAFVRLAGDKRVTRVPQFPIQARGMLSWFERDSLVPLESIQIRKVVASGSALAEPITVTLPARVMTEFVDGSGSKIPAATALELFRSLRAAFPDDVIARPDSEPSAVLLLEITPAVGSPFQVTFTDLGQMPGAGNERPGIAFQSGREYGVLVNPLATRNVMNALRAVAESVK